MVFIVFKRYLVLGKKSDIHIRFKFLIRNPRKTVQAARSMCFSVD